MPDVPKHAWTHRPRSQGGTDPIAFPGGLLPFAYVEVEAFEMEPLTAYTISILDSAVYASTSPAGTAIVVGNPPDATDDLGFFIADDFQDGIMLDAGVGRAEGGCMVAVDCGLVFTTGFTGDVVMYLDNIAAGTPFGGLSQYNLPQSHAYEHVLTDPTGSHGHATVRLAGTVVWPGSNIDPEDQSQFDLLRVNVYHTAGANQTPVQGWCVFTRLTPMITSQFVP